MKKIPYKRTKRKLFKQNNETNEVDKRSEMLNGAQQIRFCFFKKGVIFMIHIL